MGDPRRKAIPAKAPAAPTTAMAWAGESRFTSHTARTARPPPRAISGASGPTTDPRAIETNAAIRTPGSSIGVGAGCDLNPSAGECPPRPGRYLIVSDTRTPAIKSTGSGHHAGAWLCWLSPKA